MGEKTWTSNRPNLTVTMSLGQGLGRFYQVRWDFYWRTEARIHELWVLVVVLRVVVIVKNYGNLPKSTEN